MATSGAAGATRNRTELFLKYRKQARGASRPLSLDEDGSKDPLNKGTGRLLEAALASTSGAEDGMDAASLASSPQYVTFKEQIRTEMFTVKQKMNELRQLHGRAALTSFDDTNSAEMEAEVVTQDITRLFRRCEARLQQFGQGTSASDADEKVKQNVQRTLAMELQKLSVQFRKQQKKYLQDLKQRDAPPGTGGSFAVLDDSGKKAQLDEEYDPGFSEMQMLRVEGMEAFAEERDREVRNILQSINDLGQVMKDLSVLVIDQGTILDRIDANMDQVATHIEEGVKQLVRAEKHQKNSRLILCIMLLVVAVILMLIILVLKNLLL